MKRALLICGCICLLAFSTAAVAVAGLGFWLWPTVKRIDATSAALLTCRYVDASGKPHGNPACIESRVEAITGSLAKGFGALAKAMPEISHSAKTAGANSADASKKAADAASELTGLLQDLRKVVSQDLHGALAELTNTTASLRKQIDAIGGDADSTVVAAKGTLDQLTALEGTLNGQIQALDPKMTETADAIIALMSDPNLKKVIEHVEKATGHTAEITESIDTATRGLRQKAALVKAILLKLAGLVKITFAPF